MTWLGWAGSLLLAICAFPQAWLCWRQGHADGISHWLIWLWGGGELLTLLYVTERLEWPLMLNYGSNMFSMAVIAWYKYRPRKNTHDL